MGSNSEFRTITLFCPQISKLSQMTSWDDEKLDLGLIARFFGLNPSTIELNGHFIARGLDFVSSSVTWRSMLSFFSSKGISTGNGVTDALIVDGKLSKVGCKRSHDLSDGVNCIPSKIGRGENDISRSFQPRDDIDFHTSKKPRDCISGYGLKRKQLFEDSGSGLERKQLFEDSGSGFEKKQLFEDSGSGLKRKQLFEDSGSAHNLVGLERKQLFEDSGSAHNLAGIKRKQLFEDLGSLKKLRTNEAMV